MEVHGYFCVVCLSAFWLWLADAAGKGTKCYKNEEIGEYPENIYYCTENDKRECCEEASQFTCCETKSKHMAKDQIILWGCVFGAVGCITFVWICYRKDSYMCEGASLLQRCRDCKKKEKLEEEELTEINSSKKIGRKDTNNRDPLASKPPEQETNFGHVTAREVNPIFVREADEPRASTSNVPPSGGQEGAECQEGDAADVNGEYAYGDSSDYFGEQEYGQEDYPGYPGYHYSENNGIEDSVDPNEVYNPVIDDAMSVGNPQNALPPLVNPTGLEAGNESNVVEPKKKKKSKKDKKDKKDKKKRKDEAHDMDADGADENRPMEGENLIEESDI